jgi:hypothetical protein
MGSVKLDPIPELNGEDLDYYYDGDTLTEESSALLRTMCCLYHHLTRDVPSLCVCPSNKGLCRILMAKEHKTTVLSWRIGCASNEPKKLTFQPQEQDVKVADPSLELPKSYTIYEKKTDGICCLPILPPRVEYRLFWGQVQIT